MRSFLAINKRPIVKWGMIPEETYYEGKVPKGYSLCISPSGDYIVIDVDRHGSTDGFKSIPEELKYELSQTLNYETPNNGAHYWFKYTGEKDLANKGSGKGVDLRVGGKGYVVWYKQGDFRDYLKDVNKTSKALNRWIESQFSFI